MGGKLPSSRVVFHTAEPKVPTHKHLFFVSHLHRLWTSHFDPSSIKIPSQDILQYVK